MNKILGFARPDGQVGIRNKVAIIFTVDCARFVCNKLKMLYPEGTQLFGYPAGCAARDPVVQKVIALGCHSNCAGALVVGLGCEAASAHGIAQAIAQTGRPAEALLINAEGGDLRLIEKGSRILVDLIQKASMAERVEMSPADLIVGAECGGSDATSGLASNPLVGAAGDMVIDAGGTYMQEEVSELLGCGEILAARSASPQVAADIKESISRAEKRGFELGTFSWGQGNIKGGLTSIEEKSYGCLAKSGTHTLQGVIRDYTRPSGKGFYIVDYDRESGTFHADPEGINQMAARGAHLAMFTTGCGSTTGGLIPVIKVISNSTRMQLIADNADFDGTPVIRGEQTIDEMAGVLYDEILMVAAGKLTESEIHGHLEG